MADWIMANKCPKCGGYIALSIHCAYTIDYAVRRDGQLRKRGKKIDGGPIDVVTAHCEKCGSYWDGDNTIWSQEGVFVREKVGGDNG